MEVTIPSSPPPQILLDSGLSLEESPGCPRMFLMEVAGLQRRWTPYPVRQGPMGWGCHRRVTGRTHPPVTACVRARRPRRYWARRGSDGPGQTGREGSMPPGWRTDHCSDRVCVGTTGGGPGRSSGEENGGNRAQGCRDQGTQTPSVGPPAWLQPVEAVRECRPRVASSSGFRPRFSCTSTSSFRRWHLKLVVTSDS